LLKTLHYYISRDLAKAAVLAMSAFTLLVTVIAIIEPLRKRGLEIGQVLSLFVYTVPMVGSFTLPIAALLAATIVYGRFAQDNELMACRASGISTFALLRPALVLGAMVTVATLAISNMVAPHMAELVEKNIKANIRGIFYNQLHTRGYARHGNILIHADHAEAKRDSMYGVVLVQVGKAGSATIGSARSARLEFVEHEGDTYVWAHSTESVGAFGNVGGRLVVDQQARAGSLPVESFKLPNVAKESPAFYDWSQLLTTLADPSRNQQVRGRLLKIGRRIRHDRLAREIASSVRAGRPYEELRDAEGVLYRLEAERASLGEEEVFLGYEGRAPDEKPGVRVSVIENGRVRETFTADRAWVRATYSPYSDESTVQIELSGRVVQKSGPADDLPNRRTEWNIIGLRLPRSIQAEADRISLQDIYHNVQAITPSKAIRKEIDGVKEFVIRSLIGEIKAEMHSRIAFGVSCFLLVALGAALGLLLRGGNFISAFAIAMAPAGVVILLTLMGKEMASNPDSPQGVGLACIWSGLGLLAVLNAVVYMRLLRR